MKQSILFISVFANPNTLHKDLQQRAMASAKPSEEEMIAAIQASTFMKMHAGDEPADFLPIRTSLERRFLGSDISIIFNAADRREPGQDDVAFTFKGKPFKV